MGFYPTLRCNAFGGGGLQEPAAVFAGEGEAVDLRAVAVHRPEIHGAKAPAKGKDPSRRLGQDDGEMRADHVEAVLFVGPEAEGGGGVKRQDHVRVARRVAEGPARRTKRRRLCRGAAPGDLGREPERGGDEGEEDQGGKAGHAGRMAGREGRRKGDRAVRFALGGSDRVGLGELPTHRCDRGLVGVEAHPTACRPKMRSVPASRDLYNLPGWPRWNYRQSYYRLHPDRSWGQFYPVPPLLR